MIDNYLLIELVTFASTKTLSKTAEVLNVTQPTITRGMKKLEDELGVKLFDRQPNRITLTKTGELAAKRAQQVLDANQQFITTVRNYDQSQQTIKIICTAPGPRYLIRPLLSSEALMNDQLLDVNNVANALQENQYNLIITHHELQTSTIESRYLGQEHLFVNLDKFMYQANQPFVTFKDLRGISFVVLNDIGPWRQIIQQQIPDAKFLYQEQWNALAEITKYSSFPFFSSNFSSLNPLENHELYNENRVNLAITDPSATMTFYAAYLKKQRSRFQPLINKIAQKWPK